VDATASNFADHLQHPRARGQTPAGSFAGAAGGAACGDLVRISVALDASSVDGTICDAGFDADGCGAVIAAGSATVALVRGRGLLDAARIGPEQIAQELGGLSPGKRHAAELAADALHRALGAGARAGVQMAMRGGRTLVAMSGGVDSAVAALLVAEQAPERPVAVTLELWSDPENDGERSCCSAQAVRGARELAHGLGMAHLSIDLREEFRAGVVQGWLHGQASGLTPNPCVRCNGSVRLDAMLELGQRLGAGTLATGHYARVQGHDEQGVPLLRTALDSAKDQSYVLSGLAPESLARLRFPLGELRKTEVRELALRAGLAVAGRPDSQDLCFLAGTRRPAFLQRHGGLSPKRGPIRTSAGELLGEHDGAHLYTVGQRHGLGLATGRPMYVLATDTATNTVTVGPREALLADEIAVREIVLHRCSTLVDGVRVRAHGRRMACRVAQRLDAGRHARAGLQLAAAAERTAPGQIACLYAGELIVGHATIAA
jgi:tRNA-uridine 2-sulfurtransferase